MDAVSIGLGALVLAVLLFMLSITLFINYKTSGKAVFKTYAVRALLGGVIAFVISIGSFRAGLHC